MCVRISFTNKGTDGTIKTVGGDDARGGKWGLSREEVVALIDSGNWSFFVNRPEGDRVEVIVAQRAGLKYLKTTADGDEPNNLLALPERQPVITGVRPSFLASLPGARTPRLLQVLKPGQPPTLAKSFPRMDGAFGVLPAASVIVRFSAPWPVKLEVKIDEGAPLEEASSGTTSRPDLDASNLGWYTIIELTSLDREATTWEVAVVPPPSKRFGSRIVITIAQKSINPDCRGSEQKSTPLSVRVGRSIRRRDIHSLSAQDRSYLAWYMQVFLTDAVIASHLQITHAGAHLLRGHRAYIEDLERFLIAQPEIVGFPGSAGHRFVPLPKWDPATPIPLEFIGIRPHDGGGLSGRPPLINTDPQMPLPTQFTFPTLCTISSVEVLGNSINGWHGDVHAAVGGTMGDINVSPAAPIFWFWHAFVDDVFFEWESCL